MRAQRVLFSFLVLTLALGFSVLALLAKPDSGAPPTTGDTFVHMPPTPEDSFVCLNKIDDKDFAWLTGRIVKVRTVTGQGLPKPLVYPVYTLKSVEVEPETVGTTGEKMPAKVKAVIVDLLEIAALRQAICGTLPHRVVSPEGNRVAVGLFVDVPQGNGNPVLLGETALKRRDGNYTHELDFLIDPAYSYLLSQPINKFSLEFKEDYIGQFRQNDLQVSINQSQTAIQEFRNTIQRGAKPDQKVAFVAFGGGSAQDMSLKRQLQTATEVQILRRRDATLNQSLLARFLNDLVKPELVAQQQKFDPRKDADQVLTFFFDNGVTWQGTLGQYNKVELRDRIELEKFKESGKSWDQTREILSKVGIKADLGPMGVGGKIGGDLEFKTKKNDIGTESSKDHAKDVRDLFRMAEGKLPVVALDVSQLQAAEQRAAQALNHILGTFTVGRRTLTHTLSFQSLPTANDRMPLVRSDLEKQFGELKRKIHDLEEKVHDFEARRPKVGHVRIWHVNEGPAWGRTMLLPPSTSGPSPARTFKKWIEFGDDVRFPSPPRVVIGISSIEAVPARANIEVTKVTEKGFEVTIRTWHNTYVHELDFSYVALPK